MSDTRNGTALVTGASVRIGRALAIGLGSEGFRVAVHYRDSVEDAEETVKAISDAGGQAFAFKADLSQEAEVDGLFKAASDELGPITCLINNASMFENDDVTSMTRESWDAHMEPNLRAPLRLTQLMAGALDRKTGNVTRIAEIFNKTNLPDSLSVCSGWLWPGKTSSESGNY